MIPTRIVLYASGILCCQISAPITVDRSGGQLGGKRLASSGLLLLEKKRRELALVLVLLITRLLSAECARYSNRKRAYMNSADSCLHCSSTWR